MEFKEAFAGFKDWLFGGEYVNDDVPGDVVEDEGPVTVNEVDNGIYEEPTVIGYGPEDIEPMNYSNTSLKDEQPVVTTATTTQVYQQPSSTTVVMYSPYDIRTSQVVVDHIRNGNIVICNLTASSNNQRVVDYISGGIYAFDGQIEPTAVKTTFVCTPKNVNLVVGSEEGKSAKVSSL